MRRERFERNYRDTLPLKDVETFERAQLTKLTRNAGKVEVSCGHCEMIFEKYACWAKRSKNHFCSRACHNAARILRFPKDCVVCGTEMMLTPADMPKFSTCSKDCLRKNRSQENGKHTSSIDYKRVADELRKNEVCASCGVTVGPWSVMGIRTYLEDGIVKADASYAKLWCRKCHLNLAKQKAIEYYKEKA